LLDFELLLLGATRGAIVNLQGSLILVGIVMLVYYFPKEGRERFRFRNRNKRYWMR
jgi:hypothetical protein